MRFAVVHLGAGNIGGWNVGVGSLMVDADEQFGSHALCDLDTGDEWDSEILITSEEHFEAALL